tara:strand:- start:124 stop:1035 length:912 start_codon:yes stop_codon:yes gene_type:complete
MTKIHLLNDLHGWLLIDKPKGIGSTKVVSSIKKKTGIKKIGHGGTLDPDATGILALALGEATKTVRFIGDFLKTYTFTMRLGIATDTDDSSGKIINQSSDRPETQVIKEALKNFEGYISQVPPKLSAIKINGERAYKLFHQGSQYELSARQVFIKKILVLKRKNKDEVSLKFTCGKGGYVRSLARDVGNLLGCYGHAHDIRRIACGPFNVENSIGLDEFERMKNPKLLQNVLPTETVLKEFPNFSCKAKDINKILNGSSYEINKIPKPDYGLVWIRFQNIPLAFGKVKNEIFFPTRVFNILKR